MNNLLRKIYLKKIIYKEIKKHYDNYRKPNLDLNKVEVLKYTDAYVKLLLCFEGHIPEPVEFWEQNHFFEEDKVVKLVNEYVRL